MNVCLFVESTNGNVTPKLDFDVDNLLLNQLDNVFNDRVKYLLARLKRKFESPGSTQLVKQGQIRSFMTSGPEFAKGRPVKPNGSSSGRNIEVLQPMNA